MDTLPYKIVSFMAATHFVNLSNSQEFTQPSETIPSQSLTIRQIIERFQRGTIDMASLNRELYDDDDLDCDISVDDLDSMDDLSDITRLQYKYGKRQNELLEKIGKSRLRDGNESLRDSRHEEKES